MAVLDGRISRWCVLIFLYCLLVKYWHVVGIEMPACTTNKVPKRDEVTAGQKRHIMRTSKYGGPHYVTSFTKWAYFEWSNLRRMKLEGRWEMCVKFWLGNLKGLEGWWESKNKMELRNCRVRIELSWRLGLVISFGLHGNKPLVPWSAGEFLD